MVITPYSDHSLNQATSRIRIIRNMPYIPACWLRTGMNIPLTAEVCKRAREHVKTDEIIPKHEAGSVLPMSR
jgi:hypothetical protein